EVVRFANKDRMELRPGNINPKDGDILIRIRPDLARLVRGIVGQRHLSSIGSLNDMIIGYDVTIVIPNKSRTDIRWHLPYIQAKPVTLLLGYVCHLDQRRRGLLVN